MLYSSQLKARQNEECFPVEHSMPVELREALFLLT